MHDEERSKLRALRENPTVALTIDTEVHPPKILLIRGRAELDVVDGIPDEYLQANGTYEMTPEQRVEWEAEVRSLYHDGMVRIVVTPTLGEADRLRDDSAERGRGTGPTAGGASAGNVVGKVAVECREPAGGSVPGVNTATMGRTRKENMMAKYLLLKPYRGWPGPAMDWAPIDRWTPDEVYAHAQSEAARISAQPPRTRSPHATGGTAQCATPESKAGRQAFTAPIGSVLAGVKAKPSGWPFAGSGPALTPAPGDAFKAMPGAGGGMGVEGFGQVLSGAVG